MRMNFETALSNFVQSNMLFQLKKRLINSKREVKTIVNIAILGAGTLTEFVIDIAESLIDKKVVGIYDDKYPQLKEVMGFPILGKIEDASLDISQHLVIGIGEPSIRERIYLEKKEEGFLFPSIIHPSCVISRSAQIQDGVIIGPFSTVLSNSTIEQGVCLLSCVNVNHYVSIGAFSLVGAGVVFGNNVQVGTGGHISMGQHIGPGTTVEDWSYVE